jgi:ribonuclease-3
VIECKGPTNTRVYTVAVYFRGRRLASAMGHSIQQAEMNAAKKALEISQGTNTRAIQSSGRVVFLDLFPQLDHQKRVIAKSMKKQKNKKHHSRSRSVMSSFGFASKSPERYSRRRFNKSKSRSSSNSDSSPRSKGDKKRWYGSSDNELSDER